ncbi:prosaposin [Acrasis kona]|uniref:Prosaposin n=1 Tax=Acrasis kona TaxID=1008807 RepID=A0AAW2Z3B4_9EUKA
MKTFALVVLLLCSCLILAQDTARALTIPKSNDASLYCDVCAFVVEEAEKYANKSEPQIQKALLNTCNRIPGQMGSLCNTVVMIYGHQILQFLLKKETPKVVCCQLHVCTEGCPQTPETTLPPATQAPSPKAVVKATQPAVIKSEPASCALCTLLVGQVETFIAKNETEEVIKQKLGLVCSYLPTVMKPECDEVVAQYVPYLIYYLESQFPPKIVCELVNLCPIENRNNNVEPCSLCKFGVSIVESFLAQNSTTSFLVGKVAQLCNFMPLSLKDRCIEFSKSVPQLIELIESQLSADVICTRTKFCAQQQQMLMPNKSGNCFACKHMSYHLHKRLSGRKDLESTVGLLKESCETADEDFRGNCYEMVSVLYEDMFGLVKNNMYPGRVCNRHCV